MVMVSRAAEGRPLPAGQPLYRRLRPRPNGPSPGEVAANQRGRLSGAMIEAIAAHGHTTTSVAALCRLAGVSKRTFYELFEDKDDCFLATYESITQSAIEGFVAAQGAESSHEERLRAGFEVLARETLARPKAAGILLRELVPGEAAALAQRRARRQFARVIAEDFARAPGGVMLPEDLAEGIVSGVQRVLARHLADGELGQSSGLAEGLAGWTLSYRSSAPEALPGGSSGERRPSLAWELARRRLGSARAAVLRAAAAIVTSEGYSQITAAKIAERAGLDEESYSAFYGDGDSYLLEAMDFLTMEALAIATRASRSAGGGLTGFCQGAIALTEQLVGDHVLRHVMLLEAYPVGSPAHDRRERLLCGCADLFSKYMPSSQPSSWVMVEATIGMVRSVVRHHLAVGSARLSSRAGRTLAFAALAPLIGGWEAIDLLAPEDAAKPSADDPLTLVAS
jgi:AcrR family transcriptional regulator